MKKYVFFTVYVLVLLASALAILRLNKPPETPKGVKAMLIRATPAYCDLYPPCYRVINLK